MDRVTTNSPEETFAFAKDLATNLKGGEVFGLIGDLGAGKTVFAKGLAAGLRVCDTVTSPTFVIMRVYAADRGNIKTFVHIDAYRIRNAADLEAIGASDYLARPDTVVLVEWADRVQEIVPAASRYLTFSIDPHDHRRITERPRP